MSEPCWGRYLPSEDQFHANFSAGAVLDITNSVSGALPFDTAAAHTLLSSSVAPCITVELCLLLELQETGSAGLALILSVIVRFLLHGMNRILQLANQRDEHRLLPGNHFGEPEE